MGHVEQHVQPGHLAGGPTGRHPGIEGSGVQKGCDLDLWFFCPWTPNKTGHARLEHVSVVHLFWHLFSLLSVLSLFSPCSGFVDSSFFNL